MKILVERADIVTVWNMLYTGAGSNIKPAQRILTKILKDNPEPIKEVMMKEKVLKLYHGSYFEDCYFGDPHFDVEECDTHDKPIDEVFNNEEWKEEVFIMSENKKQAKDKIKLLLQNFYNNQCKGI